MSASENKELVARMYEAINEHRVGSEFWTEDMVWRGPAGIGTKHGLEQYRREHQQPYLRAFSDKHAVDEIRIGANEALLVDHLAAVRDRCDEIIGSELEQPVAVGVAPQRSFHPPGAGGRHIAEIGLVQ